MFKKNVKDQGENIPEIAKKLKPMNKNEERVRYQYTYKTDGGELIGEEPKKSLVINKRGQYKTPSDLIELLTKEKN